VGWSGDEGGGAGERFDGVARLEGDAEKVGAGVADAGRAGVADVGDVVMVGEEARTAGGNGVRVESDEGRGDAVVGEEATAATGVLGSDDVGVSKDVEGVEGHVVQGPDGGRDEGEVAHAPPPAGMGRTRARLRLRALRRRAERRVARMSSASPMVTVTTAPSGSWTPSSRRTTPCRTTPL